MDQMLEIETFLLDDLERARAAYEAIGFCRLAGVYRPEELRAMETFFDRLRVEERQLFGSERAEASERKSFDEVDRTKTQVRAMHPHRRFPEVLTWYLHPNAARALERLLGRPALAAQTMYYYKPPGSKGQGMHQDNFYLLAAPATCIAAWTPIDDADEENGCLWVVPESHRAEILCPENSRAERWMDYGDSHISRFPRDASPIPVPVRRGETLFFNGNLIHGSGPNRTRDRWRRTFIAHYCDDATDTLSHFYHPVLDMQGRVVSRVRERADGGPCGDGWRGSLH